MEDRDIVKLYWDRSEDAITQTQKKYGSYCYTISYRILTNRQDAEECISDSYMVLWNSIPPKKPKTLKSFLGAIVRNISLDRFDYNTAEKRSGEILFALEELEECLPSENDRMDEQLAMRDTVNRFLQSLPKETRIIFLRRYWYLCSVKEIASGMHMTENNVKVVLHRTREKFKTYLEKEGVTL